MNAETLKSEIGKRMSAEVAGKTVRELPDHEIHMVDSLLFASLSYALENAHREANHQEALGHITNLLREAIQRLATVKAAL